MNAKLSWYGDIMIVDLSGHLDFESVSNFRKKSDRHFTQNKVIFFLRDLSFVGSTGIKDFVAVLSELSEKNPFGLGIAEARSEYEVLLEPYQGHTLVLFKTLDMAKRFFSLGHLEFEEINSKTTVPPVGSSSTSFEPSTPSDEESNNNSNEEQGKINF